MAKGKRGEVIFSKEEILVALEEDLHVSDACYEWWKYFNLAHIELSKPTPPPLVALEGNMCDTDACCYEWWEYFNLAHIELSKPIPPEVISPIPPVITASSPTGLEARVVSSSYKDLPLSSDDVTITEINKGLLASRVSHEKKDAARAGDVAEDVARSVTTDAPGLTSPFAVSSSLFDELSLPSMPLGWLSGDECISVLWGRGDKLIIMEPVLAHKSSKFVKVKVPSIKLDKSTDDSKGMLGESEALSDDDGVLVSL